MDDLIMVLIVLGVVTLATAIAFAIAAWVRRDRYETPSEAARRRRQGGGSSAPPDTMPTSFD
ncbi:MAG TPA: hypothetical protein VGE77_07285 [Nocardioides sp.]